MDESQSQKGRMETHPFLFSIFLFHLSLEVMLCHCSTHPSPSVSWDPFVCEIRHHTCPAGGEAIDFSLRTHVIFNTFLI